MKLSLQKTDKDTINPNTVSNVKTEFSKLFLKRNGKLYSALMPQFFKKLSVNSSKLGLKAEKLIRPNPLQFMKMDRTLLLQSSELVKNDYRVSEPLDYQLTLVKFLEQPFLKTTKAVGLHAITEDYFEQDVNSVFCKNSEFIETGETIGLLNLEKEINNPISPVIS